MVVKTGVGNTYDSSPVVINQGQTLDFDNLQASPHDVFAVSTGPDGGSLFHNDELFTGPKTEEVKGVKYLPAGDYQFYCTYHHEMTGTLTVTNQGSPAVRPKISVAIKDSKLSKVTKSGLLKTQIHDSTTAGAVDLKATLGQTTLADKEHIAVAGGDSQKVSLKLSKDGKKALKGLDKAKIKLAGTVAFGQPDSAKKTLK